MSIPLKFSHSPYGSDPFGVEKHKEPRLCIECKHFTRYPIISFGVDCMHPINLRKSLVDGSEGPCNTPEYLRLSKDCCGEEGRWFEAREAAA